MNTLKKIIVALCLIGTEVAIGQTDMSGIFNSENDYKHPYNTRKNKSYEVEYIEPTAGSGNYKRQNKNVEHKTEGIIIRQHKKDENQNYNALTNPQNYKTHH